MRLGKLKGWGLIVSFVLISLWCLPSKVYALDGRVGRPTSVLLKTSGAGIAGGLLAGTIAVTAFDGDARTFFKMTSLGLYGGILFGLGVLLAPREMFYEDEHEYDEDRDRPKMRGIEREDREESLRSPLKPVQPDVWVPVVNLSY